MIKYKKVVFLCMFMSLSLSAFSEEFDVPASSFAVAENQGQGMLLEIVINGMMKIQLQNVPAEGHLEVFSILGVRVAKIDLKTCLGNCSLELAKGLYILKVGNVAQKIIVK